MKGDENEQGRVWVAHKPWNSTFKARGFNFLILKGERIMKLIAGRSTFRYWVIVLLVMVGLSGNVSAYWIGNLVWQDVNED